MRLFSASTATGLLALTAAVSLALVGCSPSNSGATDNGRSSDDPALQGIYDAGVVKVGVCLGSPNWGLIGNDGKPAGFDVEVAYDLGEYLGVETELVEINNDSRIPSLQSGNVHVVSCNFTATEERKQHIDFSDAVVNTGNSLLVLADSDIQSLDDLAGLKVGVNKGGTSIAVATEHAPEAEQVALDSFADDLTALKAGQVDAVIDTAAVITAAANADPGLRIVVDGEVGPQAYFALGLAKNQPGLLEAVNEFVADFHSKGTGGELFREWFWEPTFQFEGLEG